jgi:hypothetical protein
VRREEVYAEVETKDQNWIRMSPVNRESKGLRVAPEQALGGKCKSWGILVAMRVATANLDNKPDGVWLLLRFRAFGLSKSLSLPYYTQFRA